MKRLNVEVIGEIQLAIDYWDCECEKNYVHKKETESCSICGSFMNEQPDSRLNEVVPLLHAHGNSDFLIHKL